MKMALTETTRKRGTRWIVTEYKKVILKVKSSKIMKDQWANYQKDFAYAEEIAFDTVCDTVLQVMEEMGHVC